MNSLYYLFKSLPWLGLFTAIVLAWYFYIKAKNKERLALIEKGTDVSKIYSNQEVPFRFPWLKLGIVITGVSLGVSIIVILYLMDPHNDVLSDAAGPLMLIAGCLFGGIAMIISHLVTRAGEKKKNG